MYCRNCGKEIESDSRFCPYCGKEVATVSETVVGQETVPENREQMEEASKKGKMKPGGKKIVIVLVIVLGLVVLGLGVSVLINNAKENKKSRHEEIEVTATPEPTTSIPTPTKVPTIDDVFLFISEERVVLGEDDDKKVIRVQIVENGYNTSKSLIYEIEDTSVATCEWGEWGNNLTVPLRIYAVGLGETTIKIRLEESNLYEEIKIISNGEYTFTEFAKTMYAKSSVNVRGLPSTDGKKLGSLSEGEVVEATGQCNETEWYRIVYNGKSAYVSGNYLLEKEVLEERKATVTPIPEETLAGTYEITVWVPEKIIELTKKQMERFCKENPEIEIEVMIEAVSESDSAKLMLNDAEGGADLFCITQEQLASLVFADVLSFPDNQMVSMLKTANDAGSVRAASVNNELYCYPMASNNGYLMYYDKSVVQETHIDNLEDIIADCEKAGRKFSMELENGWYSAAFLFATGAVSEWTTDDSTGAVTVLDTLNSKQGLIALKGMQKLMNSSVYKNSCNSSDFEGKNSSAVVITGTWESDAIKRILGDNYGVADLPSFSIDGMEYHMSSFSGNKLLGVKPQNDIEKEAVLHKLAFYLTSETCQMERFEVETSAWIPSNISAQTSKAVAKELVLAALAEQNSYAVPQGEIQGMWWSFSAELVVAAKEAGSDRELAAALQSYENKMRKEYDVVASETTSIPKPTEEPKTTATPKATATPKPTEKPKATATPKPAAGTYTKKSVLTGETISANEGTGTVVYMEESRADELAIAQDFYSWCEGEFNEYTVVNNAYFAYTKTAGKTADLDIVEAYLNLLKDKYGFTIKQTVDRDPDWIGDFEYVWECTKKGLTMKVSLSGLTEWLNGEYLIIDCPDGFLFVDYGNRLSGNNKKVDVSVLEKKGTPKTHSAKIAYAETEGCAAMMASGWQENTCIGFVLDPAYKKGQKLDYSEFEEYSVLIGYKCYCELVHGSGEKGFISTYYNSPGKVEDVQVEILDNKNGYPAFYFYAQMVDDDYTRYYVEGICAPGKDEIMSTASSGNSSSGVSSSVGNVPSYSGGSTCIHCKNGYVKCILCGGDGYYTCGACRGRGTVSHYGYTSDCGCDGGQARCVAFGCNGGYKKCNYCGGDGVQ